MAGKSILDFVPLHLSALERSDCLRPWLETWVGNEVEFLEPMEWFTWGHDHVKCHWEANYDFADCNKIKSPVLKRGTFIWSSSPCTVDVAVEELRKARHKCQDSRHLFLIPTLMTPFWRKQLYKAADLVVTLPCGHEAWPSPMFEPLTMAFVFPFLHSWPWQLCGSIHLLELGRKLSQVCQDNESGEGLVLQKLWGLQASLCNLPEKLAWKVLQSQQLEAFPNCSS